MNEQRESEVRDADILAAVLADPFITVAEAVREYEARRHLRDLEKNARPSLTP